MAWQNHIIVHSYRKCVHIYFSLDCPESWGKALLHLSHSFTVTEKRANAGRISVKCYLAAFPTLASSECSAVLQISIFRLKVGLGRWQVDCNHVTCQASKMGCIAHCITRTMSLSRPNTFSEMNIQFQLTKIVIVVYQQATS